MRTSILEKARLLLRPFCEEDEKDVFECWESDPDADKLSNMMFEYWTKPPIFKEACFR